MLICKQLAGAASGHCPAAAHRASCHSFGFGETSLRRRKLMCLNHLEATQGEVPVSQLKFRCVNRLLTRLRSEPREEVEQTSELAQTICLGVLFPKSCTTLAQSAASMPVEIKTCSTHLPRGSHCWPWLLCATSQQWGEGTPLQACCSRPGGIYRASQTM